MPNDLIDPPNDDDPWGVDFEDEPIAFGEPTVEIDGENVPIAKAADYVVAMGNPVNTEEKEWNPWE